MINTSQDFLTALRKMLDLHGMPKAMNDMNHDGLEGSMERIEKSEFYNVMMYLLAAGKGESHNEMETGFTHGLRMMLLIVEEAISEVGDDILLIERNRDNAQHQQDNEEES